MRTSDNGIDLIKKWEGFSPTMYYDVAGYPTIGYGTLIDTQEEEYLKTATISRIEATELLRKEVRPIDAVLAKLIRQPLSQNQWDALSSFCYNFGSGNLKRSTLLKKVNTNPWDKTIRTEFMKWVHADGRKVPGLVNRRKEEADLYFS